MSDEIKRPEVLRGRIPSKKIRDKKRSEDVIKPEETPEETIEKPDYITGKFPQGEG